MRNILLIVVLFLSVYLFADNKISITTKSDRIIATINLNDSEYVLLNENTLFLFIESDEYHFQFLGYPDGGIPKNGDIYYSKSVVLEGSLTLKDGIPLGNYNINVILGFQTCDSKGVGNIPVELTEEILVRQVEKETFFPVIIGLFAIIIFVVLLIVRRKKIE